MQAKHQRHHGKPRQSHTTTHPSRNAQYTSLDVYVAFAWLHGEWMSTHPRVPEVPRVSCNTARITGRGVPVPVTGTVSAGAGTVCQLPTRGLPVRNPREYKIQYITLELI
jgi:hypothetical protein